MVIKYLLKKESKSWLIRRVFLLQEFDMEIVDKKDTKNLVANHLSILKIDAIVAEDEIKEVFPCEKLMAIQT